MKFCLMISLFIICYHQSVSCENAFQNSLIKAKDKLVNFFNMIGNKIMIALKVKKPPQTQSINFIDESKLFYNNALNNIVATAMLEGEADEEYIRLSKLPTALMITDKLIKLHERKVEIHMVQTEDGYVLQLHRVLVPDTILSKNKTVLLQHGLLGSSTDWVLLGKHNALPYLLNDAGYDVWLLNARGNLYARHNNLFSIKNSSFWNFTFHEIGQRDIKAAIDYVQLRKDNNHKIYFIAHSIGASSLLVLLTSSPKYNKYLQMGILLAPLAFMSETKGPLRLLARLDSSSPDFVTGLFGTGEFYPKRVPATIAKQYCRGPLLFCRNPLFFMVGCLQSTPLNDIRFVAQLSCHVPAGSSASSILHLAQLVRTGRFHPYNAPHEEYPLQRVSLPLAIFSSTDDMISTVTDGTKIFVNIVNPIEHIVLKGEKISHTEFVWGSTAPELIYRRILVLLGSNVTKFTQDNEV